MIDFACKTFKRDEIIRCSLGLTRADFTVLSALLASSKPVDSAHLARTLSLDTSTIQRTVKRLYEKQLVKRFQHNLDGGGYQYTYAIPDKSVVKNAVKSTITRWAASVEKHIDAW